MSLLLTVVLIPERKKQCLFSLTGTCHSSEHKATSLRDASGFLHYVLARKALGATAGRPERQADPSKNRKIRADAASWALVHLLKQQGLDLSENPKHSLENVRGCGS